MKVKHLISIWIVIAIGIGCAGLTIKTVSNDELESIWKDVDKTSLQAVEDFENTYLKYEQERYYRHERKDGYKLIDGIKNEIAEAKDRIHYDSVKNLEYSELKKKNPRFKTKDFQEEYASLVAQRKEESMLGYFSSLYPKMKGEDIFVWDDLGCNENSNGYECRNIKNFHLAYKNESENKDILNSYSFSGDEFELREKKKEWAGLRKKGYIVMSSNEKNDLSIGDYDFRKKSFPIAIVQDTTFGSVFGVGGIDYTSLETSKIQYPMSEEKAKEFKSNPPKKWIALMDVTPKIQPIKYYDCREPGKFPVSLSENRYKEIEKSYFAYYCKLKSGKLKVFRGKLMAIDFIE